ncbi:22399_t:CDS:2 [Dentiscutata erythropus]|uniref:22399_t:CDS:1 n=1 Tax=Dentiscutata erythropus TaxID=1348616 RepID=A0A9N9BZR2_9GLOM|nr:22399_t:CDS:2 [Dentiscutata erythropus]
MLHKKSSTRKMPYNKKKKNDKSSTWTVQAPKTRQQKIDERLNKTFVIKRIDSHLSYLGREKKRAPVEDRYIYDNEISWYDRWKQDIKAMPQEDPLIFKEIFFQNKQLRQEISIKKARINELEDRIEQVKSEKNREIEELNIKMQIDAEEAVNRHKEELDKKEAELQNIKNLYIEKHHDLERENNELKKKIEKLEIDLERSLRINGRNVNTQYQNLRERTTAYQIMLNKQGIKTTPVFERAESEDMSLYFYEDENNDN